MKAILLASTATVAAVAFMSDYVEVVTIKGENGKPLRVNKSDFDADQASAKPSMVLHKDDDETQQPAGEGVKTFEQLGISPVAAPSAPDFTGGGEVPTLPIDPAKGAAAPIAPSPGQKLVTKEGTGAKTKFFVVDGSGIKLEIDGIDKDGYKTEKEAWDAILALPH